MCIDDPGQRRFVRFGTNVSVRGPDQLIAGHAVARRCHACQAEIGSVGEERREERILVVAGLAGTQIGEGRGSSTRMRAMLTSVLTFISWAGFIIGHVVNNARGLGS